MKNATKKKLNAILYGNLFYFEVLRLNKIKKNEMSFNVL